MKALCLYLHMVLFVFQNFTKWNFEIWSKFGSERFKKVYIKIESPTAVHVVISRAVVKGGGSGTGDHPQLLWRWGPAPFIRTERRTIEPKEILGFFIPHLHQDLWYFGQQLKSWWQQGYKSDTYSSCFEIATGFFFTNQENFIVELLFISSKINGDIQDKCRGNK